METLREQLGASYGSGVVDVGHLAVVDFERDAGTYVTEAPLRFGPLEVFTSDLGPEELKLLSFKPFPMRQYDSLRDFVEAERLADETGGTINFLRYFQRDGTIAAINKRDSLPFVRLSIVAPELVADLGAAIGFAEQPPTCFADFDTDTLCKLYGAYQAMTQLVSQEDALRLDEDGNFPYYDHELLIR